MGFSLFANLVQGNEANYTRTRCTSFNSLVFSVMLIQDVNRNYAYIGKITCWITFLLGIIYVFITFLGFQSLQSHDEPIADPYFSLMELLSILIALFMSIDMLAIHFYASRSYKFNSLFAVCCMFIVAGITSSVHFVVLTMSHQLEASTLSELELFFSFKWPSVVYLLDILAWDWFFSLSFLSAASIFYKGRLEKIIRILMLIAGSLALIGILGVPFNDMQIRNIGIVGYAVIAPFVFLLIGLNFNRLDRNKKTNALQGE